MKYSLFTTLPEIEALGLNGMVVVANYLKSSAGTVMTRNKRPSTFLWDNMAVDSTTQNTIVLRNRVTGSTALLESGVNDGAHWRYYNSADKSQATIIWLLAKGSEKDLYECNPSLDVSVVNGVARFVNTTTMNGKIWSQANLATRDVQGIGCMWMITGVSDPNYLGSMYVACGKTFDFNRGSGRVEFCKITKRADIPLETTIRGANIDNFTTDYVYKAIDVADPDVERLSFTLYHGVKATEPALILPLNTILP